MNYFNTLADGFENLCHATWINEAHNYVTFQRKPNTDFFTLDGHFVIDFVFVHLPFHLAIFAYLTFKMKRKTQKNEVLSPTIFLLRKHYGLIAIREK